MTPREKAIGRKLRSWREENGILRFVKEELGAQPDPWQEKALLAYADPSPKARRLALLACAGPGKTALETWCGWWFMTTQGEPNEHPKGMVTSITGDNLKANIWPEFAKWQGRSEHLRTQFTWTASRIFANDHPATWVLEARSWPKTANAEEQGATFSGLHSRYVTVIVDESGAIPSTVLRAAEQALSTAVFAKILQSGNPISLEGMLYEAANRLRAQWNVIRITGDPDDPLAWVHSPRVAVTHISDEPGECACPRCWAKLQIETYGRENPWVKSYILGQFPPSSINTLLGVDEVEAAIGRQLAPDSYNWQQKRVGIDVARFGDDRTVLFPRQGLHTLRPIVMRVANTAQIAAKAAHAYNRWTGSQGGDGLILIDDTGHWGHGVYDQLVTAGYPTIALIYSDKAMNPRFLNRRAENWMGMAEWVKGGGQLPLGLPEIIAELTTPTYSFLKGQFVLEPKDLIKKRLGRSPDLADALSNTFGMPDLPNQLVASRRQTRQAITEDNPYAFTRSVQGEETYHRAETGSDNPYDDEH